MCAVTPTAALPTMPDEPAIMRQPDSGSSYAAVAKTARQRRTMDQFGSRTPTILTSGRGVTKTAPTERKTILGQ